MKYKPGTIVVVTHVPEQASRVGVCAGMPALVELIENEGHRRLAEDCGLTMVRIGMFCFWWNESDLGFYQ